MDFPQRTAARLFARGPILLWGVQGHAQRYGWHFPCKTGKARILGARHVGSRRNMAPCLPFSIYRAALEEIGTFM